MPSRAYAANVFINCPYDGRYKAMFRAIVFTVYDCGFQPRAALEQDDAARDQLDPILEIIADSRLGIHDISRTGVDLRTRLPRFNMPFELGVFLGARHFGSASHRSKITMVLDSEPFRYQQFLSDLAGHRIKTHGNRVETAIKLIRDWLKAASHGVMLPGDKKIWQRYCRFRSELPGICDELGLDIDDLPYPDYALIVEEWLAAHPF